MSVFETHFFSLLFFFTDSHHLRQHRATGSYNEESGELLLEGVSGYAENPRAPGMPWAAVEAVCCSITEAFAVAPPQAPLHVSPLLNPLSLLVFQTQLKCVSQLCITVTKTPELNNFRERV